MTNSVFAPVPFSKMMDGATEIDWLVDRIVPRQTSGIFAGEPGIGKTWIVMDLVLCLATGRPWIGEFETIPSKVLIVDEENAHVLIRRRFQALRWRYQCDSLDNIEFLVGENIDISPMVHPTKGLVASIDYTKLYETVAEGQYDVVIVDSLTRIHHNDENDSSKMSAVFAGIKRLMGDTGCSVIFTHHYNKGSGRSNNRVRGSSDILAFPDYVVRIETDKTHYDLSQNGVVLTHGKSRWGENVGSFCVKLSNAPFGKEITPLSGDLVESFIKGFCAVPRSRGEIVAEANKKNVGSASKIDVALRNMVDQDILLRLERGVYVLKDEEIEDEVFDEMFGND